MISPTVEGPGYYNPVCEQCALCNGCVHPFLPPQRMDDPNEPPVPNECILVIGEAPGCFLRGTPVFTEVGVEDIESVSKSSSVKKDLSYYVADYPCVTFKVEKFPEYTCTAQHRILIANRTSYLKNKLPEGLSTPSYEEASSLLSFSGQKFVLVEKKERKGEVVYVPLRKEHRRERRGYNDVHIPDYIELTDDVCFALGSYMGDGAASFEAGHVSWFFSEGYKEAYVKRLVRAVTAFGLPPTVTKVGKVIRISIYSRTLASFFLSSFGNGAYGKHIPDFMLNALKPRISAFLFGWYVADGGKHKNLIKGQRITTISPLAAWGAIDLGLRFGVLLGLNKYNDKRNAAKNWKPTYNINFDTFSLRKLGWAIPISEKSTSRKYGEDENYYYLRVTKAYDDVFTGTVYDKTTLTHSYDIPFRVHNSNEDEDGVNFHPDGASGRLIRKQLDKHGLADRAVFVNSVRCRPKDNKLTNNKPVRACSQFLWRDIEALRPMAILMLGNKALCSLTKREGITNKRRQVMFHTLADGTKIPMMAAYHPAYALYDRNSMPAFEEDIASFARMVSGDAKDPVEIEEEILGRLTADATPEDIRKFHKKLIKSGEPMAFDAETNSLAVYVKGKDFRVTMLSFSDGEDTIVARLDNVNGKVEERNPLLLEACLSLLRDKRVKKIGHNVKYDMHALWVRFGLVIPSVVCDTQLMHAVLFPITTSRKLEDLSIYMLGVTPYHKKTGEKAKGKDKEERWLRMAEDGDLVRRAALDAACTKRLSILLRKTMKKEDKFFKSLGIAGMPASKIFSRITMPAMKTLWRMERNGFPTNMGIARALEAAYSERISKLTDKLQSMPHVMAYTEQLRKNYMESPKALKTLELRIARAAKIQFNPKSPQHVADVLSQYYRIPAKLFNKTPGLLLSADKETLARIKGTKHYKRCKRFIALVSKYRHLVKGHGTYIKGVVKCICDDGCVHATYRLDVARTGRTSSSAPNLQNISRKHMDLRAMYACPEGWKFLEADYSQIELRVLAAESGDKTLVDTYIYGRDLHDETARDVWKIPKGQPVPDDIRTKSKNVNFGIVYMISAYGLQRQIGGTEEECQARIDAVYKRFPGVKRWQKAKERFAQRHGRVYSLFGHWRDVNNAKAKPARGNAEDWASYKAAIRQGVNAPIQGAAGLIMLISLIRLDKEIRKRKWTDRVRLVNTVHDSVMLLVKEEHMQEVAAMVKYVLESEPVAWLGKSLRGVPIKVDMKTGASWAEMTKLKEGM